MRLGSILARFGGRPGGIFVDFLLAGLVFAEIRRFSCQEASKSDPGPKKSPKWSPNASQNNPQIDPKSRSKKERFLDAKQVEEELRAHPGSATGLDPMEGLLGCLRISYS